MKLTRRISTIVAAAAIAVVSIVSFTGCDTNHPKVTITYEFNGTEYEVHYVLSRKGAPQTVRHFIELADAGYYDGMVIHDYESDGSFIYGGGYTVAEEGDSVAFTVNGIDYTERDYWTWAENYVAEGGELTTSVWMYNSETDSYDIPTYTVYGEFHYNGCSDNSQKDTHSYSASPGALVMYYTEKGTDTTRVAVSRSDDGDNNDGDTIQVGNYYKYNSATSMFYTWTGTGSRSDLDKEYCVFGHAEDYEELQDLLDAVADYEEDYFSGDEESFTEEVTVKNVNQYDIVESVRNAQISATYNVPNVPIYIKSVEVTKY